MQQPQMQQPQMQQPQAQVSAPALPTPALPPKPAAAAAEEPGGNDQERFVGHVGVTYFGVSELPFPTGITGGAPGFGSVPAPVIGIRYWLSQSLGLDLGLGLGLTSASTDVTTGGSTTSVDQPSVFGGAVHAGVPLALSRGKHYAFELTPEATFGFTSATAKPPGAAAGAAVSDISLSGSRIELGARVGAEIFFGFIGVPELALQASVGLHLRRDAVKYSTDTPSFSADASRMTVGTTVEGAPWAIFVNNISAIYYF
jgi:hypothetical protein